MMMVMAMVVVIMMIAMVWIVEHALRAFGPEFGFLVVRFGMFQEHVSSSLPHFEVCGCRRCHWL